MSKWKLVRQSYGSEEFTFKEGDKVLVGRALTNTITLSSIVISRNHCVIDVKKNNVLITDLKSANGIYVGANKIPPEIPYTLSDSDVIGIGWTLGVTTDNIINEDKYDFKLVRESSPIVSSDRIQFQSENEFDDIEDKVSALDAVKSPSKKAVSSPILNTKLSLKRPADINIKDTDNVIKKEIKKEKHCRIVTIDDDVVDLLSDSDVDHFNHNTAPKKIKLEPLPDENQIPNDQIKSENGYLEFEAFNVKQEHLGYEDEPIQIDSESDSESENWFLRLSQNSPGKPFIKLSTDRAEILPEDCSYSQMDDDIITERSFVALENEEILNKNQLISPLPPETPSERKDEETDSEDILSDIVSFPTPEKITETPVLPLHHEHSRDEVDTLKEVDILGHKAIQTLKDATTDDLTNEAKKMRIVEPHKECTRPKTKEKSSKSTSSSSKSTKHKKSSSRISISNSQKEERKKKLKEIATKIKDTNMDDQTSANSLNSVNKMSIAKVTNSSRGAFLMDSVQVVKPTERSNQLKQTKTTNKSVTSSLKQNEQQLDSISSKTVIVDPKQTNSDNKCKNRSLKLIDILAPENTPKKKKRRRSRKRNRSSSSKRGNSVDKQINIPVSEPDTHENRQERVPLKSLKPLTESDEIHSGKPFSKVEPMPPEKPKKKVRFSEAKPDIHVFEIEPGNKMKRTSLVKTTLVDIRQMPLFSLEKITLMKILRWNPHWLEEQINLQDPPPILGHNTPMTIFHAFANHAQYVQMIGDLLLMEIWECLTIAYMKIRNQNFGITMRIASLPPLPTQERIHEFISLSVNISLPSNETKNAPRAGEILLVNFGSPDAANQRFFYVHNVRLLPSPPNNIHTFYCISLYAIYTEKMKTLRTGEVMVGRRLAYINKELNLFEAMEYLAGSPLSEIILRPEPRHFQNNYNPDDFNSQWTKALNPSQHAAVAASVGAALSDKPSIQMVQGPPGTGKSSVICSIVMTYFYNEQVKKQPNRGKLLICATSNAAVDELVIRLLNIRQGLPKEERFRMVRVGRAEAMAARARHVSSQQLAQRDSERLHADAPALSRNTHALREEISHLEAKINMWKTQAQDAKDPVRVAYCQGRVNELLKRITLVKGGGGGEEPLRPEQLAAAERRIIEGADIVVTTLASAQNHKMKGLKGRIALCIVDEAGQAIEPETLAPLTLDVTKLTLIGDPQQLPGYICSQRAKKYGLGESLFARAACGGAAALLLRVQYRMHAAIADYPNRAFYGALVASAAPPRPALPVPPYALLALTTHDRSQGASGANEAEAACVSRVAAALAGAARRLALSLAVITPYNAHKDLIKRNLKALQPPGSAAVEVNTVDSFQGQERDVVVVSLARSHGVGFLTDAGRMNVMLTRARHALLLCLNPHAMLKNHQWQTLVEDAQRRRVYKVLPKKMCQPISPGETVTEDILQHINTK